MKKSTTILYWIFTILFAGFMIFSAVPNMLTSKDSVELIHTALGYPVYFIAFIGVAKIIGGIVILIPGLNRLKEWAYAGLMFDLIGATYSVIAIGAGFKDWVFMLLPILVGTLSYIYHIKKSKISI
ncbi:MAG: DoxX family protein [Chitinophagaceae bacterium]